MKKSPKRRTDASSCGKDADLGPIERKDQGGSIRYGGNSVSASRFCSLPPPSVVFPHSDPLVLKMGRSRYGPKRQVQGDLVTLEKAL